ncbi:MAG: hypothetical protein JST86_03490, partial [Bacteroidetes bacterium]|nr:hypothetical protein [Bacteroidota bacterium]
MSAGAGTLYLNGSSAQTIGGTQTFKTYNLVTNNGAGFIINNNLSVSGVHTFTNGMLTTSATLNYLVYEAGSSYTSDNDARHVNGWVKKLGSTDFVFPVGNATYERTIALTNLSASSEFNVRHNNGVTPNKSNVFSPIVLVDTAEYWTINKISGASAKVNMNWDNSKIAVPQVLITGIRAGYYNGSFWTNIGGSATGAVATTGSVISNSVSSFNNNFTIASTSWVLRMDIISFTGSRTGVYNKLNWAIANEQNVLQYELQRSADGVTFSTINTQAAQNNNSMALYTYDDAVTQAGKWYYRLRCTDILGAVKYSAIIQINIAATDNNALYVIKNPVKENIEIFAAASAKGKYQYTIANTAGQVMQAGTLDIKTQGVYNITFNSYFTPGVYVLLMKNDNAVLQKTIMKQ